MSIIDYNNALDEFEDDLKINNLEYDYDRHLEIFRKYHPCYKYAMDSVNDENVPKYVKKQCAEFLDGIERNDDSEYKYFFDLDGADSITDLLYLINFSSGVKSGTAVVYGLAGFQWFLILNTLCWYLKENPDKRRYEKSVLLIGRKSGKDLPPIIEIL